MEKILRILKINILSLLALPILLVATASKMAAKAMEKLGLMLGMGILTLAIGLIFEAIKKPEGILQWLLLIIVFVLIGFVFILLAQLLITVAIVIYNALIAFFNSIYEFTYLGYLKLFETCQQDFQFLNLQETKRSYYAACLLYSILLGLNKLIVGFISISLYLAIGASAVFVISSLLSMNSKVYGALGINLFTFLGKFDAFTLVYGIVMFVSCMATVVITLLSLGIEWHEWAQELKMTSEEYGEYVKQIQASRLESEEQRASEQEQKYVDKLSEHLKNVERLERDVDSCLASANNPVLRSTWSDYLRALTDITGIINSHKGNVPEKVFKKLLPRIDALDKQYDNIKKLLKMQKSDDQNPTRNSLFFSGCNTPEKLEKRYKSLCKAYHPDTEGGDEETFKALQAEYERLKAGM